MRPSGIVEVLPAPVARRVEGLKGVHTEYCKLEHELKREMLDLEKKVSKSLIIKAVHVHTEHCISFT
jgi:hypothetical protein